MIVKIQDIELFHDGGKTITRLNYGQFSEWYEIKDFGKYKGVKAKIYRLPREKAEVYEIDWQLMNKTYDTEVIND